MKRLFGILRRIKLALRVLKYGKSALYIYPKTKTVLRGKGKGRKE